MTLPCSSSITRRRMVSTIRSSWVAMTTVVPVRLMRSSSFMMSWEVVGSRFPVGSSQSISRGRLTNARAIETRCCSPPDSSCGKRSALSCSPTSLSTSGTVRSMEWRRAPITSRASDRDALLLATGQLVREAVGLVVQPHQLEHLGDGAVDGVATRTDHLEREGDVLTNRLVRQELEVLEDAADRAAQRRHLP